MVSLSYCRTSSRYLLKYKISLSKYLIIYNAFEFNLVTILKNRENIFFQTNLDVLYYIKCIYHEKFYQNIRVQYVNPSTFRRSICTYACNVLRAVYESEPALCVQSLKTFTAHLSIFVCICTPGENFSYRYFILILDISRFVMLYISN